MALQARYPLIQRLDAAADDAAQGRATQAGGPFRYLLQANTSGAILTPPLALVPLCSCKDLLQANTSGAILTAPLALEVLSVPSAGKHLRCHQ